ncbi:MAG: hypothetical protein HYX67_12280, partial [Candidatus Melainabacteria bacterium]|nr:hypothetical protein [Candidatus Melainabacteria bacterium]
NLKTLCSYPLKGKKNTPVFDKDSSTSVINQCNTFPDKISVYFMRKSIAEQSRGMTYVNQVELVKRHGFEVISLRVRAFFDAIKILDSETCPDDRNSLTYARTSDIVRYGNNVYQSVLGVYQSVLGGFVPRAGVFVLNDSVDCAGIGVVPGVPAEVLRP